VNGNSQITYSSKNIGFDITQFYSVDIHPSTINYFLAGAQDNGTQRFSTTGISTTVEASLGGDGGFTHIDQTDGVIQVLSYVYNNFYYSRNSGATFTRLTFNNSGFFINPSDYDDARKVLYSSHASGQYGLLTGLAGTGTPSFTPVVLSALGNRKVSAVKVDPTVSGGGTVWMAGYDSTLQTGPWWLRSPMLPLRRQRYSSIMY
jgi:hypothetical protein